jgi:glycerol-3-phosphate cytidylyltransferase
VSDMKYKIGFTCGTFDLCHAGHMLMFEEVKNQCDHLIVGLQNDPSIDRPEKNKPVQSIVERQIQLHAIRYIDDVIVYNTEADLLDLLKTLPISVRFVGEDHKDKDFTGRHLDVHPIVFNSRMHSFSTSDLRSRVIASTIENSKPKTGLININDLPLNPSAFYNGLNGITASDLGYTKK